MDFVRLYKKEFMRGQRSFGATLVITLCVMLFFFTRIGRWDTGLPTLVAMMVVFGFGIAAFIKSFDSLKEEWKHDNQYLMLSLPVRGYSILGAKLAYFMTEFGSHMLLIGAYTAIIMLAEIRSSNTLGNDLYGGIASSVWRAYGLCVLPTLYILTGAGILGLFSYTVVLTIKKFGFWVGTASYILPLWLLSDLSSAVMKVSPGWMHIEIPLSKVLSLGQIESALDRSGGVINFAGLLNGTYVGIDMASVLVWTAGMIGLFYLASWLLENKAEV